MSAVQVWGAVIGLVVITVVTRSFFFLSRRALPLPGWVERGLRYAPVAALAAVVLPGVLLEQGQWPSTAWDARWLATPVAMAYAWWRRDMLGTLLVGIAVYGVLRWLGG